MARAFIIMHWDRNGKTWNRSVGWYAFAGDTVTFRKLTINGSSRPVLVKIGGSGQYKA